MRESALSARICGTCVPVREFSAGQISGLGIQGPCARLVLPVRESKLWQAHARAEAELEQLQLRPWFWCRSEDSFGAGPFDHGELVGCGAQERQNPAWCRSRPSPRAERTTASVNAITSGHPLSVRKSFGACMESWRPWWFRSRSHTEGSS